MTRLLTIMGSGETSPTMIKTHRELLARLGGDATAVVLDTPYGFQENAPELATRAQEYFAQSVGRRIEIAGLLRFHGADPVAVEQGLGRVRTADYVFAGPGSPSYALRQWAGTAVPDLLAEKLRGGAVTFASAAALTLGLVTVPVYEIYKSGDDPHWLAGLDLLAAFGMCVAVVPHYDNAEGGHHDTRYCYLGERRLRMLEEQLPPDAHVIGVDEHTGVILDFDADTATVVGNGVLTVRVRGSSTTYPAGSTVPIDELRSPGRTSVHGAPVVAERSTDGRADVASTTPQPSLAVEAARLDEEFGAALARRDAIGAARAVLELDDTIRAWSADTLTGMDNDIARATLRSMIVRLGDAADAGLRDPREVLGPSVELLVELRDTMRADHRYDLSDLIRDRLAAAGIELRDTSAGTEWHFDDD